MNDAATGIRAMLAQIAQHDATQPRREQRLHIGLRRLYGNQQDLIDRMRQVLREEPTVTWEPLPRIPVAPSPVPRGARIGVDVSASVMVDADERVHVIRDEGRDRISYTVDGADVLARCRAIAAKYLPDPLPFSEAPPRPESPTAQAGAALGVPRPLWNVKA